MNNLIRKILNNLRSLSNITKGLLAPLFRNDDLDSWLDGIQSSKGQTAEKRQSVLACHVSHV